MNWRWVDRRALELLHDESIAEHGGTPGLRDEGLFESALARPLNLAAYGQPDLAELAAAYGLGLAKNHPFVDGNKGASSPWAFPGHQQASAGGLAIRSHADHAGRRRRLTGRNCLRRLAARPQPAALKH
jgi:hypothetical protein